MKKSEAKKVKKQLEMQQEIEAAKALQDEEDAYDTVVSETVDMLGRIEKDMDLMYKAFSASGQPMNTPFQVIASMRANQADLLKYLHNLTLGG
jgi:uncharacterized membrane-anchored protein YhcB (DUF1043 family)